MTHHVHPYAHRLGILRDWKSRWFGVGTDYKGYLRTDVLIRKHLAKVLRDFHISTVDIERRGEELRIIIKTSRPGLIIGRSGEGITKIKQGLERLVRKQKLMGADVLKVDVEEVKSPESDAAIVATMVTEGLEKRMPFRRIMKQTAEKVMANRDVKGVRIVLSGRLGGADMARTEQIKKGRIPLQTFRADVDYAHREAYTPQGQVGTKVWVYRGDVFEDDVHVTRS